MCWMTSRQILLTGPVVGLCVSMAILALQCNRPSPSKSPAQRLTLTQATEPAVAIEPHSFEVNVLLSDTAKKKFALSKETLIAACYVTGVPSEGTHKECTNQISEEIAPGEVALFKNVELPKGCVSPPIEAQESELLINVFSSRKSSPQNLLDCDIYQGSLKDIQGRRLNLSCSLIGE